MERIKIEQRRLSKKKRGSNNYEKQRKKLAKYYEKLTNQRNMVRNHNLAQKILDASLDKFLRLLEYKAEKAGVRVVKVNPRGTSKGLSYKNKLRDYISACRIKSLLAYLFFYRFRCRYTN